MAYLLRRLRAWLAMRRLAAPAPSQYIASSLRRDRRGLTAEQIHEIERLADKARRRRQ